MSFMPDLSTHFTPRSFSDRIAFRLCQMLRWMADTYFKKQYGHRALVIETVASIPGMVGAFFTHMRCLRKRIKYDENKIQNLLNEAANERVHFLVFLEIVKPSWMDKVAIYLGQFFFGCGFFVLYFCSVKTAHRMIGYFEEEAVKSYLTYLQAIEQKEIDNVAAPDLAQSYWKLPSDAKLSDVIISIIKDEIKHREYNHFLANRWPMTKI